MHILNYFIVFCIPPHLYSNPMMRLALLHQAVLKTACLQHCPLPVLHCRPQEPHKSQTPVFTSISIVVIIMPRLLWSQAGSHSEIEPPKAHHQMDTTCGWGRALAARAGAGENRESDPAIKESTAIKLLPLLRTALCVTAKHSPWLIKPSSGAWRAIKSLAKWLHFIH